MSLSGESSVISAGSRISLIVPMEILLALIPEIPAPFAVTFPMFAYNVDTWPIYAGPSTANIVFRAQAGGTLVLRSVPLVIATLPSL